MLGTFTDSGARRTLQRGPIADTAGWRTVTFRGVALEVPAGWLRVDLRATPVFTDAPGDCGLQTFPSRRQPMVFVETGGGSECATVPTSLDLSPGQGVWLQGAGADPEADPLTQGRIGGLEVTVVDLDLTFDGPDPALDLVVETGERWVWLTIGVEDPSVARAILRSIHRA